MTMIITELMAMVTGLERWKTSCSQAQLSVLGRVLEQAVGVLGGTSSEPRKYGSISRPNI